MSEYSLPLAKILRARTWFAWGSVGVGIFANVACAQDALRDSLAGEQAAEARKEAIESIPAFMKLGDAKFGLNARLDIEANDNINLSDVARQQDLILRPGFSLVTSIPVSEVNAFYLGLDVAYAKYINHSEFDRILLAPGTEFGFDLYTSGIHVNFHDRVSYTENPIATQGQLSGVADFGEFSNGAGITADWDLRDILLTLDYNHGTVISATSAFSYLNNNSDSLVARATFRPDLPVTYGIEASTGWTYYDETLLSPSQSYSFGAFADWKVTDYLHILPRAGYVAYLFGSSGSSPQVPNESGYYVSAKIQHRVNRIISYDIEGGHDIQLGVYSDLLDLWYARPSLALNLVRDVPIIVHATYERGTDVGNTVLIVNENYSRLEIGVGAIYRLTKAISLRAEYDHVIRESNVPLRGYHQNRILLDCVYEF
jgi:opacity protein-like surface antigen